MDLVTFVNSITSSANTKKTPSTDKVHDTIEQTSIQPTTQDNSSQPEELLQSTQQQDEDSDDSDYEYYTDSDPDDNDPSVSITHDTDCQDAKTETDTLDEDGLCIPPQPASPAPSQLPSEYEYNLQKSLKPRIKREPDDDDEQDRKVKFNDKHLPKTRVRKKHCGKTGQKYQMLQSYNPKNRFNMRNRLLRIAKQRCTAKSINNSVISFLDGVLPAICDHTYEHCRHTHGTLTTPEVLAHIQKSRPTDYYLEFIDHLKKRECSDILLSMRDT